MLERIDLPLMVMSAAKDDLVDGSTHGPLAARVRHGELVTIAGARHEIMMETDEVRAEFWTAFDRMAKAACG
jgi:lysophospholipase